MSFALLHPKGVGSFRTCRGLARRIGAGCVGGLVVLVMGPIALASDKVPTPSAQAKTSAAPVRAASPAGAESKATEPAGAQDPMDRLQQRLAERLGSRMARSEETPDGELKVVARPASGEAVKPQAMRGTAFKTGKIPGLADAFVAPVWAYEGPAGPEKWAQLKREYAACAKGTRQSPIDVRGGIRVQLDPVQFDYQKPAFRVIDDGRTVRVNVAAGNFIEVAGRRYELTHLQFHKPSEVLLNGKSFDMSVHLIHRDAQGHIALLALLLQRGEAHPAVQSVWNNLPLEKGVEMPARVPLDLLSLLPKDQRYATFMGSMTSPPCQEGVLWIVMKTPVSVSDHQLAVFSHLYPMNARPVQPSHGRLIKESE